MSRPVDVTEPQWFELAACRGRGWDRFFEEADPAPAQQVCAACPVRGECLRFAVGELIPYGIWGGLTPEQRRWLRIGNRVA